MLFLTKHKIFSVALCFLQFLAYCQDDKIHVTMIGSGNRDDDPEISSAFYFITLNPQIEAGYLTFAGIKSSASPLNEAGILWFHRGDTSEFDNDATDTVVTEAIKKYVSDGGCLLLSLDALRYLVNLGIEKIKPQSRQIKLFDEGYGRKAGLHAFRYHPAFEGLNGGAAIYAPKFDLTCRQVGYFGNIVPSGGKVFAVDWAYIFIHEDTKLALEYDYGKGKIIAVGAYMLFAQDNANRAQLELFTNNIIRYINNKQSYKSPIFWEYTKGKAIEVFQKYPEIVRGKSEKWEDEPSSPVITEIFSSGSFWDIAGQRMLLMGKEKGGISEVWCHPFMAVRDYTVGITFSNHDSVIWLDDQIPQIEVRPESFRRIYKFSRAYLTETVTCSIDDPASVVHYEYRGVYPAKLVIKFRTNLRLMWPYPENTTFNIKYSWDEGLNAFVFRDNSENNICIAGSVELPDRKLAGQYEDITREIIKDQYGTKPPDTIFVGKPSEKLQVTSLMQFNLKMNDNLDVVITASGEGIDEALKVYKTVIACPSEVYRNTVNYYAEFFNNKLKITTPDDNFNRGYRWALAGTDRFFVNTPGVGKSLVAGYSTTDYGWDGGQKVSGRPGYAWYFGRDAVWSSFALLDYGDYEKTRNVIENFCRYQDLSGKIYHELTTSGVVHYDAADATPLFIILAGKYLAYTGDVIFIRNIWKSIIKAIDFCYGTDTDGDMLIENTNVGHGWEEGGALFGCHTTLYLASLWAEALNNAAYMAGNQYMFKEAGKYKADAQKVIHILNTAFWNGETRFLNHGLFIDGKYQEEQGVMPAVPMYFRQIDEDKTSGMLEKYAGNGFSSDWGCRIISSQSKFYNPKGYHTGSVWPLFTGWVSLAEYKNGRPVQGFSHIMDNLQVYKYWSKGFVEEVLNGQAYKPAGVTHHQCWSETMVLQPLIEGMLGILPDAAKDKLCISPSIPASWDYIKVENIRTGSHIIEFDMYRSDGKIVFLFIHKGFTELDVGFNPQLPAGIEIREVKINGTETNNFKVNRKSGNITDLDLSFRITDITKVEIFTHGGISVIPLVSAPKPGQLGEGFRLLKEEFKGKEYNLKFEGRSGSKQEFQIYIADNKIGKISGGQLVSNENNIITIRIEFPGNTDKYIEKSVSVKLK